MSSNQDPEAAAHQPSKLTNILSKTFTSRTNRHSNTMDVPLGLEALNQGFSMKDHLKSKGLPVPSNIDDLIEKTDLYRAPYQWSVQKKMTTLSGTFIAAILAAYAAGAYAMATDQLVKEWGVTLTEYNIGITIFVAGFGVAPMVFARISETQGRYWVFVGAGVVFFLGTLGCAVTKSYAGMLVARFITGCGASIFATLTGGVVSDLFDPYSRNTPMALYSMCILMGTGFGPLISGILADRLVWNWIFYLQFITIGLTTLCIFFFFTETRANVILKQKCKALNKLCSKSNPGTSASTETASSPVHVLNFTPDMAPEPKFNIGVVWTSFAFPMRLLGTESVVFWFSAWVSFAWAILYMQFSSIGLVFKDVYNFNNTQVGAVYTAVIMGGILGCALNLVQDPILRRMWPGPMSSPEGWLYAACIESILLPIGLFWFGWSATPTTHWIAPALAIGSCTMGIYNIYLAVFNYLAETYHRYASSAQAAQSMCRNLLAGAFPLFTHIMFRNLGVGVAGTVLGCIALVLTSVPWLLCLFGEKIRARSPLVNQLKDAD